MSKALRISALAIAGATASGLIGYTAPALAHDGGDGIAYKRDDDSGRVITTADLDDDDDQAFKHTSTGTNTNTGGATNTNTNTGANGTNTGTRTRGNNTDHSRNRQVRDHTDDGPGRNNIDHSRQHTNDGSRHNTRG